MIDTQSTKTDVDALIGALRDQIRGDTLASDLDRAMYSTDASNYKIKPVCVVAPRDVGDVQTAVRLVGQYGASLIPRGGGTSLSGQSVGVGVALDLSKYMNQVTQIQVDHRWVEAQAGAALGAVNRALAPHALKIGPDPSSGEMATIGGMAGNNSTGAHSILYGMMADHVQAVDVVLSDGSLARFEAKTPDQVEAILAQDTLEAEIYRAVPALVAEYAEDIVARYPKTWRNVAGYNLDRIHRLIASGSSLNLAPLIVGSEGTLAVITSLRVNLVDLPRRTYLAVVHFDEMRAAMESLPIMLAHAPAAVELIDRYFIEQLDGSPEWGARVPEYFRDDPAAVLVVEFYGDNVDEMSARAEDMQSDLHDAGYTGQVVHLASAEAIETLWNIRKAGMGLTMSMRSDAKPQTFVDDAAVPIENLPDFIEQVERICDQLDARAAIIGHASAGCIHISPTLNTKTEAGVAAMRQLSEQILQLAMQYEGSTTGEHGEGIARSYFNEQLYGPRLHRAFRQVKSLFDPRNLMNPGKIIDAPEPWDPSVIRLNPAYKTPYAPNVTWLDFSADGGFAGAVEMCNGQGFCRKTDGGVMCPSYMATRDERHATRGRANALRSAISGELGPSGLISEDLYDALDLCIECKACQRECPSIVDMAKMKAEFLAQYQAVKGVPLRSRLFANVRSIFRLGAAPVVRPLVNWSLQQGLVRRLMEISLGVSAKRSMPALANRTFIDWFQKRDGSTGTNRVVLWDDTFMTYTEPEIGVAAVRLLEAAGYQVEFVRNHACCGRPMISKGLLDHAKAAAQKNVDRLTPYVQAGVPIVGLEPSCVSAFRDEYPDLLRTQAARDVSGAVQYFEEFIGAAIDEGRISWIEPDTARVMYAHGHCHQRAQIGADAMMRMLSAAPDTTATLIDSGCCGMAGSFGYEREHYELSLEIGEDRLFPAVRSAPQDAIIVAPGASCRHQIMDATGRRAAHPVVALAAYLPSDSPG